MLYTEDARYRCHIHLILFDSTWPLGWFLEERCRLEARTGGTIESVALGHFSAGVCDVPVFHLPGERCRTWNSPDGVPRMSQPARACLECDRVSGKLRPFPPCTCVVAEAARFSVVSARVSLVLSTLLSLLKPKGLGPLAGQAYL